MPHKHRRDKSKKDANHDLPPTIIAKPLPVAKKTFHDQVTKSGSKTAITQRGKQDGLGGFTADDTPKSFARLLRFQAIGRFPSGLDDGSKGGQRISKKRKRESSEDATGPHANTEEAPKIRPGEKMSDFATRVNAALPISGLAVKGGGRKKKEVLGGIKERQTRLERKMQKMQAEWRKEEQRRREKREEERDEKDDDDDFWGVDDIPMPNTDERMVSRKKNKKRRKRTRAELDKEDPWEQVRIARNEAPRKLHDVVQAPPKLLSRPKQVFRVANGARVDVSEVPKSAGSLRKREELGLARKGVLEGYRRMMEGRRGAVEVVTSK
ncbi:MAG: hypothetical protein M1816_007173 [Peltula sp. TS41687]|nr:MAG: hypothetical protein M1816_007173 [Peltula sp. TS41687]